MRDEYQSGLRLLMWVSGFVLLIACANVANLMLVRAASRRQHTSVRTALGASRSRQILQVLTESAVLAVFGGVMGVGFAFCVHPPHSDGWHFTTSMWPSAPRRRCRCWPLRSERPCLREFCSELRRRGSRRTSILPTPCAGRIALRLREGMDAEVFGSGSGCVVAGVCCAPRDY